MVWRCLFQDSMSDANEYERCIYDAIETGYRLIDTAAAYEKNEKA